MPAFALPCVFPLCFLKYCSCFLLCLKEAEISASCGWFSMDVIFYYITQNPQHWLAKILWAEQTVESASIESIIGKFWSKATILCVLRFLFYYFVISVQQKIQANESFRVWFWICPCLGFVPQCSFPRTYNMGQPVKISAYVSMHASIRCTRKQFQSTWLWSLVDIFCFIVTPFFQRFSLPYSLLTGTSKSKSIKEKKRRYWENQWYICKFRNNRNGWLAVLDWPLQASHKRYVSLNVFAFSWSLTVLESFLFSGHNWNRNVSLFFV